MKHSYIRQHDKEGKRTLMFLLELGCFRRLYNLLELPDDLDFIEVSNALVINDQNGIRYNFEMSTGEQFMIYGEHVVAEIQIPDKQDIPDIGSISSQMLIHVYESDGYSAPPTPYELCGVMQAKYGVQKEREELMTLLGWLKNEAYLEFEDNGGLVLTNGGRELAKTLSEGRKKGSPPHSPFAEKKEPEAVNKIDVHERYQKILDSTEPMELNSNLLDKVNPDALKKPEFTQTPEEKHNAIITILTPMKERGDPAETLIAVGDSASYLASEVVNAIRVQWPELLDESSFELLCHACTFPIKDGSCGCPACGALDHLPDDVFPADAETLGESILRIANAIPEPFQRGDMLLKLHEEERWKDTQFEDVNNELLQLVEEEAQLYFDPKDGFRVTVREEPQNVPCKKCGRTDVELFPDYLCPTCTDYGKCDECGAEHPIGRGDNFSQDPRDDEKWLCDKCFDKIACPDCGGDGMLSDGPAGTVACKTCSGTGEKTPPDQEKNDTNGHTVTLDEETVEELQEEDAVVRTTTTEKKSLSDLADQF